VVVDGRDIGSGMTANVSDRCLFITFLGKYSSRRFDNRRARFEFDFLESTTIFQTPVLNKRMNIGPLCQVLFHEKDQRLVFGGIF